MINPGISVVVPVYNGEKTLRQCLNSVLDQTYGDYEVVVVDDGSTDETRDIITDFQRKSEKVVYVLESRRGRALARNAGIREAKGDIIAMTDADCVVPKNWLQELTRLITHGNESAVVGSEEDIVGNYWTTHIQKANSDYEFSEFEGVFTALPSCYSLYVIIEPVFLPGK